MTMRNSLVNLALIFAVMITICSAFIGGYLVNEYSNRDDAYYPILNQALTILENHAFDAIPAAPAMEYGMIRGMLQAYGDPHTTFVEPVQHELETNQLQGNFGGIGVELGYDEDGHIVLSPYPKGPAKRAGLIDGDHLLMVDAINIEQGMPLDDVKASIRGPEGEEVSVVIRRDQISDPITFYIQRESISLPSVTWRLHSEEKRIGIIKINLISANTPEEIEDAVTDLKIRGATYFIIDLRGNTGGLLSAGVDTARLFLKKGVILQEQYRDQEVKSYHAASNGVLVTIPLAVVVDHSTASAAEIIAGALQAQERAPIIGIPTYGKDTIQLVFNLQDGSSLHVTSAHWWIPDLDPSIKDNGIQPDILIAEDLSGPDPAIAQSIETLLGMK